MPESLERRLTPIFRFQADRRGETVHAPETRPGKKAKRSPKSSATNSASSAKRADRARNAARREANALKWSKSTALHVGLQLDEESLLAEIKNSRGFVDAVFKLQVETRRVAASSDKAMWQVLAKAYEAFDSYHCLTAKEKHKAIMGLRGKLADIKGPRVNSPDEARLLLHLFIDYRGDRVRLNRDALALRYAHRTEIEPGEFYGKVSKAATGGLDRWSREESKAKRATTQLDHSAYGPSDSDPAIASKTDAALCPEGGSWTVTLSRESQLNMSRSGAFCLIADWGPRKRTMNIVFANRVGPRAKSDEAAVRRLIKIAKKVAGPLESDA